MKSIREAICNVIAQRILPRIERDGISNLILSEQITPADCDEPIECNRPCNRWHHEHELGIGLVGRTPYCVDGKRFIFTPGRVLFLLAGTPHRVIEADWRLTKNLDPDQSCSILWLLAYPFGVRVQVIRVTRSRKAGESSQPFILLDRHFSTLTIWLLEQVRSRRRNYARIGRGILIEFLERCLGASAAGDEVDAVRTPPSRRRTRAKSSRRPQGKSGLRPRRRSGSLTTSRRRGRPTETDSKQIPSAVREVQDFIHSNYHMAIGLTDIAGAVDISPNHLGQQFKAATGLTPVQYLMDVRMAAARQLLMTDLKAIEVGRLVGIKDPCYFSRLFRRLNGVTPLTYRRQMANQRK